jgi:hypothetical protein
MRTAALLVSVLLLGCGDESQLPQEPAGDSPEAAETSSGDGGALQEFIDRVEVAQQLVRDAADLLSSIASSVDARAARKQLDELSDEIARLRDEMASLGVDPRNNVSFKHRRVKFFSTMEKLRGALVPLQAQDSAWRAIKPSVDRFYQELEQLNLGI